MELPNISIITPTYNKKSFFPIAIHNFLSIDYPHDKIEWIIVDDGDESIRDILPDDNRIKYYYYDKDTKQQIYNSFIENVNQKRIEYNTHTTKEKKHLGLKKYKLLPDHRKFFKGNRIPIGMKRNICVQYASSNYIVHMDDDDFYPPKNIISRIKPLIEEKVNCVGCSIIGCFHINKLVSMVYTPNENFSPAKKISVASLAYTKNFWLNNKFENQDMFNEGEHFLKKRLCKVLDWKNIIVALFHSKNDKYVKLFQNNPEPNGWHFFPLSNELFTFITELDKDFIDKQEKENKKQIVR